MNPPIVIDNGFCNTKVGFSGQESPKSVFPTIIGLPKEGVQVIGGKNKDFFVGYEASTKSDLLELKSLFESESTREDLERIWHHCYFSELGVIPEQHPVIIIEKRDFSPNRRELSMEVMFETFNVPGYYSGIQEVFSLFSIGKTTGLVWDAGDSISSIVPVFESYHLPHACVSFDVSGSFLTKIFKEKMEKTMNDTSLKVQEAKIMKEKRIRIAPSQPSDGVSFFDPGYDYEIAESLFKPELFGNKSKGIHHLIRESILKVDIGIRKEMKQCIMLCGGTSMINGLPLRLETELLSLFENDDDDKSNEDEEELESTSKALSIIAKPDRKYSAWTGASILGSLDQFKSMMINKNEYQENGSDIIHFHCFS